MKKTAIDYSSAEHAESETNESDGHEFLLLMARNRQYRLWRILALLHKQGQGLSAAGTSRVISERAAGSPAFQYLTNITSVDVRTT